jgi:hypothetical protein
LTSLERRTNGGKRRRLGPDQQREVARLYSESNTSSSEIREQLGISESSVYRILQKQGIALRGHAAQPGSQKENVASTNAGGRRPQRVAAPRVATRSSPRPATRTPATATGAKQGFRISFYGQQLLNAASVGGALRQAEALGATDILEITRID